MILDTSHSVKIRPVREDDLPTLWALVDDYKYIFLNDYVSLDREGFIKECLESVLYCLVDFEDYPIGLLGVTDLMPHLLQPDRIIHGHVTCVIRPEWMRRVLKSKVLTEGLDLLFKQLRPIKLKTYILGHQTCAIKLLKRHGFMQIGRDEKGTLYKGRYADVLMFALNRSYWKFHKKRM